MATLPRVFTIPPGAPFIPALAEALLARRLVAFGDDPLDLAGVTILLPTRRAVRAFRDELIHRLGGTAILPAVQPIGDIDEDEQLFEAPPEEPADRLALPRAIPALARRLALTRAILDWGRETRLHALELLPGEPLRVPGSAADAAYLAADLARLIDDLDIAGKTADDLTSLAPDDHAEYFRLTLQFLRIVTEEWPAYLAGQKQVNPAFRRDFLIRAAAARVAEGRGGPIVAAGSTGSIPATAELLRAVSHSPDGKGAVVLPGLDQSLDDRGWAAIGDGGAAEAHPQFFLKKLIGEIGVARDEVIALGAITAGITPRMRFIAEALRPSETLDAWSASAVPPALGGIDLIEARNEQEEALAIAVALREAILTEGITAALVTPDRGIARRVSVELTRWKLTVDDSAGTPLSAEPTGVFARLLLEAASTRADPVTLLALLKHPLPAFGMDRVLCRRAARVLELALFRGRRVTGGIAGLANALAASRARMGGRDRDIPAARRRLSPHDWDLAAQLVSRVTTVLGPMESALGEGAIPAARAASLLGTALREAATDDAGSDALLADSPTATAMATLLQGLGDDAESQRLSLPSSDAPQFFAALMAGVMVPRPASAETRIHIWGTLEARLQSADVVVLAGLDESVWPAATRTDPWLSRTMRAELRLPSPERRTGQAAHDFVEGLANPRVVLARALKRGGAPTVESRWLQRIRTLAGDAAGPMAERGAKFLAIARALHHVPKDAVKPVPRPRPAPPVAARPKSLSITQIETLIRDPYAIYARHILKLEPLEPLGREPDAALRGTLIHKALGDFTIAWRGDYGEAAAARLAEIARETLAIIADYPDAWSVWTARFAAMGRWFMQWELARAPEVAARSAEVAGALAFPVRDGAFTLSGRADRIDLMKNGTVEIYDFKTGTPQTEKTLYAGLTPQLTLEAAMVKAGSFDAEIVKAGGEPLAGRPISVLSWLAMGNAGRAEVETSALGRGGDANLLAADAHAMFAALVAAFDDPTHPYLSRTRPRTLKQERYTGDYDHLARVREWSLLESEDEARG